MERLFDWIPGPAPDLDPGFAGMTVHTTHNATSSCAFLCRMMFSGTTSFGAYARLFTALCMTIGNCGL